MEMYFVITPVNPQNAGYQFGDYEPAPEADYYSELGAAIAAAKILNAEMLEAYTKQMEVYGPRTEENIQDALNEQGAFVIQLVWNQEGGN